MDSSRTWYFVNILVVLLKLTAYNQCAQETNDPPLPRTTGRFEDIAQAINFMQTYLGSQISEKEKCERYAVLLDVALGEKYPFRSTVLKIVQMNRDDLDKHYEQLGSSRLSWLYMCAIDKYRITQLAPPFIEIVECLAQVDNDGARRYLENQELLIVIDLYKKILGVSSDTMIDKDSIDYKKFHPSFRETLTYLFSKYLDTSSALDNNSPEPSIAGLSKPQSLQDWFGSRRRERLRLHHQRSRLMKSDTIQKYKDNRRKRVKELREKPATTPKEFQAKRLDSIRRLVRNERTKIRRKLREQEMGKLSDISQAINFIHKYLSKEEIPALEEDMCERYAVLLDIILGERLPIKEAVSRFLKMDKGDLDERYKQIDTDSLSFLYMCAIDRYRMTQLAPPIVDLVECLRQVDGDAARKYLKNGESIIILELYKKVLGLSSDTMIDINSIDFMKFKPSFRESLSSLFSKYFDIDSILGNALPKRSVDPESRTDLHNRRRREQYRLTQLRMRLVKSEVILKYKDDRRIRNQKRLPKLAERVEELEAQPVDPVKRKRRGKRQGAIRELRLQKRQRLRKASNSVESVDSYNVRRQRIVNQQGQQQQADVQVQQVDPFLPMSSEQTSQPLPPLESMASFPVDLLNEYIPGPYSPHLSLDLTSSKNDVQHPLGTDLFKLHDSLLNDTELQHLTQEHNKLVSKATSDRQGPRDDHKSNPLISFEPNSQEEPQFRQELMDYAARWNNSGSIVEFLLEEPVTSQAPGNDNVQDSLVDGLIEIYNSLPDEIGMQHLSQEYNNLVSKDTSDRQGLRDNLESPLISFEPNSQKEHQFRQELMQCAARWDDSGSIIEFLMDEPATSETSGNRDMQDPLVGDLIELYSNVPDEAELRHLSQEYNNLFNKETSERQVQSDSYEYPFSTFGRISQEGRQFGQESMGGPARSNDSGSVMEFLLDEPATSEALGDSPGPSKDSTK